MTVTRRNVAAVGELRRSSIWEEEADEYWKTMEPVKKQSKLRVLKTAAVILAILLGVGGIAMVTRGTWDELRTFKVASIVDKLFPPSTLPSVNVTNETITELSPLPSPDTTTTTLAKGETTKIAIPENKRTSVDLLRARCRVRGVQTRWHEETCRKLCIRDPMNSACMNGCSYGSITVTKLVCDELPVDSIPTATQCPSGVSCATACNAYSNEKPFPDLRNSCERACSNIAPSSCNRILQIYRDLYKGTLQ